MLILWYLPFVFTFRTVIFWLDFFLFCLNHLALACMWYLTWRRAGWSPSLVFLWKKQTRAMNSVIGSLATLISFQHLIACILLTRSYLNLLVNIHAFKYNLLSKSCNFFKLLLRSVSIPVRLSVYNLYIRSLPKEWHCAYDHRKQILQVVLWTE